jgi:hypothetical protein
VLLGSGEGKVLFDISFVGIGTKGHMPKLTLALATFAKRQMALALFSTE